jgi:hypothetical protein
VFLFAVNWLVDWKQMRSATSRKRMWYEMNEVIVSSKVAKVKEKVVWMR